MRSLSGKILAVLLATTGASAPRLAHACGGGGDYLDVTFNASIIGAPEDGLVYDPYRERFADPCVPCAIAEMSADWQGFFAGAVPAAEWDGILLNASLSEIDGLIFALKGDAKALPASFRGKKIATLTGPVKDKAIAALFFLGFARRVEPWAHLGSIGWSGEEVSNPGDPSAALGLQKNGEAALARAKDAFLRQRYAFQLVRLRFYRRAWAETVTYFDAQQKALAGPSASLAWRARYYAAGAAIRGGNTARGHLELARVHAGFPTLAPVTANDFAPVDDAEWKASLALAKTPADKAALWRLVGVRYDGVAAMREIARLDPKSKLFAALAVREINKLEGRDATKDLERLTELLAKISSTPGADRPWLLQLVAAHAAALRGDVPVMQALLDAAAKAHPGDANATAQAHTTLVLGLAIASRKDPARGDQLAAEIAREPSATDLTQRAFHLAGGIDLPDWPDGRTTDPTPDTIRGFLAKQRTAKTPFEKFLVSQLNPEQLGLQLVQAHLVRGEFTQAVSASTKPGPDVGCDPFALGVRDDYDCATQRPGLTQQGLARELAALEKTARGTGDEAATAALAIGTALFRLHALDVSRDTVVDTTVPLQWAARAYDLAKGKELKAKAAFLAARCETLQGTNRYGNAELPVPGEWFKKLRAAGDTQYQREVLEECGYYRTWHASR